MSAESVMTWMRWAVPIVWLALVACGPDTRPAGVGQIIEFSPELAAIVPAEATLDKLADGFGFLEGPVWIPEGALLFSDMRGHRIHRWTPDAGISVFPADELYARWKEAPPDRWGPNGLAIDQEGRLTICEHGNRRVTRLEKDGSLTILAERYQKKRLNSPNDLVYRSDGLLYFTDPFPGLPGRQTGPEKELPYNGVFFLRSGDLHLASDAVPMPNGLALSPDEAYLYVDSSNREDPIIMRFHVMADGTLSNGQVFFDGSGESLHDLDGMKVDVRGNLFVTSSAGIVILNPAGQLLGIIKGPEQPANVAWGGELGTLYITADTGLYRIRLSTTGSG